MLFSFTTKAQVGYLFVDLVANMISSWDEGGYEAKYTSFNNEPAFMHGVRGGWFVSENDEFLIGVSTYMAITRLNEHISLFNSQKMYMMNGSFYLDYTFFNDKPFNVNPQVHLGGGFVNMDNANYNNSFLPSSAGFYMCEPDLNFCVRLGSKIKIGTGFGYRFLSRFEIQGANSQSLSGPVLNMFIKFGPY